MSVPEAHRTWREVLAAGLGLMMYNGRAARRGAVDLAPKPALTPYEGFLPVGMTLAQKILARKSGRKEVLPGEIVEVDVDLALTHDVLGPPFFPKFESFNRPIWDPARVVISIDHLVPAPDERFAVNNRMTAEFARKHGVANFYPYNGPCHQMIAENGHALPGSVVVGTDSHTCTAGAFGAFATGIGSTEMVAVFLSGRIWFKVPETIRFRVGGRLPRGVMAKDLVLKMLAVVGPGGATYQALEYTGETIAEMPMDERLVLSNMAVEMGAKVGLVPPDQVTADYLRGRTGEEIDLIEADGDAAYRAEVEIDASTLEPMVAYPHNPGNGRPISEVQDEIRVDQGFIGSCTGGRLSDLRIAARILEGQRVAPTARLIVVPASRRIYRQAMEEGILGTLFEAGAIVESPGCGPCVGRHLGCLAPGEVCITASNRNFRGRMGSTDAALYLASPATVAASMIEGRIADPREYM